MAIKKKRCRENNKGGMITSRFVCMVNLNCILAIFPEWGQKVPPLSLFGGEKRHHISEMMGSKEKSKKQMKNMKI